ncbi:uncharacterized protein LOC135692102 [Rhopilema esculentum]|uniref:uncharacterized protein LOC135692102 n=1 Tax=Rhopilema esculentum TaxID=499914 RepID=UPI0031D62B50|eukprot:gene9598-17356_t
MESFGSKTIVITGVTAGLGLAMCEYFVERSHIVIGCGRRADKIDDINNKFSKEKSNFFCVDVSSDEEVEEWAKTVIQQFGPPDLLINNAGIINRNERLWNISAEEFDKVIDVNIKGTANCIRHFVPSMVEAQKGVIVNFSSRRGKAACCEVAPYCCTKWGIEGLSKALALELPAPMACVPLNPGVINTEMLQTTLGSSAKYHMTPKTWAKSAGDLILSIDRSFNGKSLDA